MNNPENYYPYFWDAYKHRGDLSGEIFRTGTVVIDGSVLKRGCVSNTGGVLVNGPLCGKIKTTGEVIILGGMMKGSVVDNTGGGEIRGVFDGTFKTTGDVKVYGKIGPNARIIGGKAIAYQKVKKTVTEYFGGSEKQVVERWFWEPI